MEMPSSWVVKWAPRITRGPVLDVACGSGRHAVFFKEKGFQVVGVDRQPADIPGIEFVKADLEDGKCWPLAGRSFGGIVVTNYLHRPLFPHLTESLAEGGVLIYETFMAGNERFGRPSNPQFLLQPGELKETFAPFRVLGFEEGEVARPRPAMTQRICIIKEPASNR
ncbi:MAG TPA: class I SAM-dependent methyltransferase [Burkholderiales bacterium]|nr:class I SAM-dependent methyltransferase [Burkholderiales bacterium]